MEWKNDNDRIKLDIILGLMHDKVERKICMILFVVKFKTI